MLLRHPLGEDARQSTASLHPGPVLAVLCTASCYPTTPSGGASTTARTSGLARLTAFALATALYQRTHTGEGQFVDVSMLDTMLNFLACQAAETMVTKVRHVQNGNRSISRKPTADRFRCGDRYIVLAVMTEKQFVNLMTAIDRADTLADPRFADWPGRTEHRAALREIIESALSAGDASEWEARLKRADIPFGRVHSLDEIIAHRQVVHRGVL